MERKKYQLFHLAEMHLTGAGRVERLKHDNSYSEDQEWQSYVQFCDKCGSPLDFEGTSYLTARPNDN